MLENKQPLESGRSRKGRFWQIVSPKDPFLPCQFFTTCTSLSLKEKEKIDLKCPLPLATLSSFEIIQA